MQAITLSRARRGSGGPARETFDDELVDRVRPLVETFTDEELERMDRVDGPFVLWLLDADGLPTSGVICDRETGRRTRFRLPLSGRAIA
jgi:hypothetical protein